MDWRSAIWLLIGSALPSFLISFGACFVIRRQAVRWGLLDHPGARKVHQQATPLGGGLAIWAGVLLTFAGGAIAVAAADSNESIKGLLPEFAQPHLPGLRARVFDLLVLLGGGTVLMLIGLIDDRRGLRWQLRLGVQFAVATAVVVWQGWTLTAFIPVPAVTYALSVLWIAALINAFNMLDNMDGLSSGVAVISSAVLAGFLMFPGAGGAESPQLFVAGFLLVLVGALLGFWMHNRPTARLFMGDAGSYFVGFCVAVATLLATYTGYHSENQHALLAPLCVMAVPLYDMLTVMWIRVREGRSVFEADKSHFSHRLVDLGMTKTQAVLTIYLTTATCGLGALLLRRVDRFGAGIIVLLIGCVLSLIHILESSARRKRNG